MTDVVIGFEGLVAGTVLSDQYADQGVTISTLNSGNPMVFDTANPTGGDDDLASDTHGGVAILSEDNDSSDPDDDRDGGTFAFDFASPADIKTLDVLDTEEGGYIKLFDEDGCLIKKIWLPCTEDGGEATVCIDVEGVARMEVSLCGSGAIDNLNYAIDLPEPEGDGIVEGTDGDDLIDLAYDGDPQGDMIDDGDAILPGEGPDDDIVYAGDGDDTVMGGEGDDTIYGDRAFEAGSPVSVTYTGGYAGYHNQLFAYTIDPDTGEISNVELLSSDVKAEQVPTTFTYEAAAGSVVGVGIISPDGTFYSSGHGDNVGLNSDGLVHTKGMGVNPDGSVNVGFEDLKCLGDKDFDDVNLTIDLGTSGATFDNAHYDYSSEGTDGVTDDATGDDVLYGEDGDDAIYGGNGNDEIYGGDGSDSAYGGDGDDVIDTSGSGSDTLPYVGQVPLPDRGYPGLFPGDSDIYDDRDYVEGGAGNDTITTGDDNDVIYGGTGEDTIDGGLDDDQIYGGDDNDTIIGGEGSDLIKGGSGDDVLAGGLGRDAPDELNIPDVPLEAGDSPDLVTDNGMDEIYGGDGNDVILGQDDDDLLYGDAGDDIILGGVDDDTLYGGTGKDLLWGGELGQDVVYGGDDQDLIVAGRDDVVEGGEGGVDNDSLLVNGLALVTYENGDPSTEAGTVTFFNGDLEADGTMQFSEIEQVYVIGGNVSPDPLSGPSGDASDSTPLASGLSADTAAQTSVQGGTFTGNSLNGVVEGTSGDDLIDVDYDGDPDGDKIDNGDGVNGTTGDEDVVAAYGGDDVVRAGLATDIIFGGAGDDELYGEQGNDGLDGGSGDDQLFGGEGRDLVFGNDGDDTISGDASVAGDGGDKLLGGADADTFVDIGADDRIEGGETGDDNDTLDLTGSGPLRVVYTNDDPTSESGTVEFLDTDGNVSSTATFIEIENVIPCFTPGTMIATPTGQCPVEQLQVGDKVITRDNGIQEIRWYGQKFLDWKGLNAAPHLRPVMIRKGALGSGLPERDMVVSPNHRLLIANDRTSLYFEEREVLVAAKHLVNNRGVERDKSAAATYIHFMFDAHQVVLSDGAWTESFQPGDYTLNGIGNAQRNEIFELFPDLQTPEGLENYVAARKTLKRHEASLLAE